MSIKTLVIDDEKLSRNRIIKLLSDYKDIDIIGEADNGTDAVYLIDELTPELVFLDIQMPGLTGFQVLEKINHHPVIIFITAFDEYAVKAFEVNAVDYILKPLSKDRFAAALEKAMYFIEDDSTDENQIDTLLEYFNKKDKYLERITIKKKYEYIVVDITTIDFFKTEDSFVYLHSNDVRYTVDITLNSLEDQLDPNLFFRAHRKAIVNISKIKSIVTWGRGAYTIKFPNGENVHISKTKVNKFKSIMGLKN